MACAGRLRDVYIEHDDAIDVINRWDTPETFFYCDPPYPGTDQGHYAGYTTDDLDRLVAALDDCQGSFLLSNYRQDGMPDHWERFEFNAYMSAGSAAARSTGNNARTEVVWRRLARPRPQWPE